MTPSERSARLQRVGPGTPGGNYLRRFWHPIAVISEFKDKDVKPVTLLGEKLVLFKNEEGEYGLLAERCPHRGAALTIGFVEGKGLRCPYHSWQFDPAGNCLHQPSEPEGGAKTRGNAAAKAYPVQVLGGMVFAYLGPQPLPLLPRFEFFADPELDHDVGYSKVACNWVQIAENNMDPYHIEFLHMAYTNVRRRKKGLPPTKVSRHKKIDFEPFEYGIIKKRLWEGDKEENNEEWTVGHPVLYPGTAIVPYNKDWTQAQIRVPVDDTTTIVWWYNAKRRPKGQAPATDVPIWDNPWQKPNGELELDTLNGQDMAIFVTQGPISDHSTEHLVSADRGVAMFRKILLDQIDAVEQGRDPLGVVRDPAKNQPYIDVPCERHFGYSLAGLPSSPLYTQPPNDTHESANKESVPAK